jgi:PKD repeat protein
MPATKFLVTFVFITLCFQTTKMNAQCKAAFSFTQTTYINLHFTSIHFASQDSTTTYLWTFGDGDSAQVKNPQHMFADTGWYDVCLHVYTATDSCSADTCLPLHIVNCQANFTWVYDPTYEQPEASVYFFTDSSQGEDATTIYSWVFAGDISGDKNPAWTFDIDDAGPQSVCLTITNRDNSCINTHCDTITIQPLLCPADSFAYTRQGLTSTFYPWTCGYFHKVIWDFGDGTVDTTNSTPDSIMHNYPSATDSYYVCLTIGYDSICQYWIPCTSIYCHTITATTASLNNPANENPFFSVDPNPVDRIATVSVPFLQGSAFIQVFDLTGRRVRSFAIDDKIAELDVADLNRGLYLIQLQDSEGRFAAAKLVKQ